MWYRTAEFYYDSRKTGRQQTDGEYADDLARLAGGRDIRGVVLDPSAASFREELIRRGWTVYRAENARHRKWRLQERCIKMHRLSF